MTSNTKEISKLRQELAELRSILIDHRDCQLDINAQIMSHLQLFKRRKCSGFGIGLDASYVRLNEKYRKKKMEVNILHRLLGGRFEDCAAQNRDHFIMGKRKSSDGSCLICNDSNLNLDDSANEKINKRREKRKRRRERLRNQRSNVNSQESYSEIMNLELDSAHGVQSCLEKSQFTYSKDLQKLIDKPCSYAPNVGPIKSLNMNGAVKFEVSDSWKSTSMCDWSNIIKGEKDSWMISKYILLPDELGGLIVRFILFSKTEDEFAMGMFATYNEHNSDHKAKLPLLVGLRVDMGLSSGDVYESPLHLFHLMELKRGHSYDSSFLHLPVKDVDSHSEPDLVLRLNKMNI